MREFPPPSEFNGDGQEQYEPPDDIPELSIHPEGGESYDISDRPAEAQQYQPTFERPAEAPPPTEQTADAAREATPEIERVAVTAVNNVMLMATTEIPLFPQIAEIAQETWTAGNHEVSPRLIDPEVNTPGFEVRYRVGTELTAGAEQVLDIAAGLTPRGLSMATDNPDMTYVEFDLPVTSALKGKVLETLEERGLAQRPENLHLVPGNALDKASMAAAAARFDPEKPVTITSEGLLHYLSHDEKVLMANGVREVLQRHGGTWYTDMPVQEGIAGHDSPMAQTTAQQTKRSIAPNRFATNDEARAFFAARGLEVKQLHSYVDPAVVDSITSIERVGNTRERFIEQNRPWAMWAIGLPEETPEEA